MKAKFRIVAIEVVPGAKLEKIPRGTGAGSLWQIPIVYVLADGRRVPSMSKHNLRRDAFEELMSLPERDIRNMSLEFIELDSGRVTHIVSRMFGGEIPDSEFGVSPPPGAQGE